MRSLILVIIAYIIYIKPLLKTMEKQETPYELMRSLILIIIIVE